MNVFLIIGLVLAALCFSIGLVLLIRIRSFITYEPTQDPKAQFKHCFDVPGVTNVIEIFLALGNFIMIFCDCVTDGKFNTNHENITFTLIISGIVFGLILGLIYWYQVKRPFFMKYFPEKFEAYKKENRSIHSTYIYEANALFNFIFPLYSLGSFIAILVAGLA